MRVDLIETFRDQKLSLSAWMIFEIAIEKHFCDNREINTVA